MAHETTTRGYTSEISPSRRRNVLIGIGIYLLGFIFLASIGRDINSNPYIIRAFLAPFLTLVGIIWIVISLYRTREKND